MLYEKLEKIFTIDKSRSIVSAVSADPIAWSTLTEPAFLQNFIEANGNQMNAWTIAGIVLFSLGIKFPLDTKGSYGEVNSSEKNLQIDLPTVDLFDKVVKHELTPYLASEVGTLALELDNRLAGGVNYQTLVDDVLLRSENQQKPGKNFAAWKTAFSVLFELVNDPTEYLRAFLYSKELALGKDIYLHILFTQQLNDIEIQEIVNNTAHVTAIETQVSILKPLYQSRYRNSVKAIAENTIQHQIEPILEDIVQSPQIPAKSHLINDISRYKAIGDIYHLAEKPELASGLYQLVERLTKKYLEGLNIQSSEVELEDSESVIKSRLEQIEKRYDWQLEIAAEQNDPSSIIDDTEISERKNNVSDENKNLDEENFRNSVLTNPFRVKHSLVNSYVASLSIDKLPDGFFDTLNPITQLISVEPEPVKQLIKVAESKEDYAHALELAYHFYLHYPGDINNLRTLASLQEHGNNHLKAYQFLQKITSTESVSVADWLNYGRVSHYLGYLNDAKTAFSNAIKLDGENGKAYAHLGRVYFDLGDKKLAENNLNHATIIAPYDESVWLLLAGYYQLCNENEQLITTLRSAHVAIPNSQSIKYELADAYHNLGLQEESMRILESIAKLAPENKNLVKKVYALAYTSKLTTQFNNYLEEAYHKWPSDSEVVFLYAKQLEENGKFSEAIAALMKNQIEEYTPEYIHFAVKLLMHLWLLDITFNAEMVEFSKNIYKQLECSISGDNRDIEFELDLAEMNLLFGDFELGFNIYHGLMDLHDEKISYMHWRMHRGLAVIAANSKNFDAALAALNTAIQEKPSEETLYLLLAKFNFQDSRLYEANKACDLLLCSTSNRLDTLDWIITQLKLVKQYGKAVELVKSELLHAPVSLENNLQLIELLILSGETQEASEKLEKLLQAYSENDSALQQISLAFHDMGQEYKSLEVFNMSINGKTRLSLEDYFTHAYLLMANEKYQDSIDVVLKGMETYPEENILVTLHAEVSACAKDYANCITILEKLHTNVQQIKINSENQIPGELIRRLVDKRHLIVFTKGIGIVYRLAKCYVLTKNYRKARELVKQEITNNPGDLILLDYLSFLETVEYQSAEASLPDTLFDPYSYDLSTLDQEQENAFSAILVRQILAYSLNAPLNKSSSEIILLGKINKDSLFSSPFTEWEDSRVNEYSVSKNHLEQAAQLVSGLIEKQSITDHKFDLSVVAQSDVELSVQILCRALCDNYLWNQALDLASKLSQKNPDSLSLAKLRIEIFEYWFTCSTVANQCNISNKRKNEFIIAERFFNEAYKSLELFQEMELKSHKDKYLKLLDVYSNKSKTNFKEFDREITSSINPKTIACIYTQNGEYQKGLDVLPIEFTDHATLLLKALSAVRLSLPEAINYSEDALSTWPDDPLALYLYSQASKNAGLIENALQSILRAIEVWPEAVKWSKEALSICREVGDIPTELYVLEELNTHAPDDADLTNRLSDLYARVGETEKSNSVLEKYLVNHPNDIATWIHLSDLFTSMSNYSAALEVVKQGLKHNSGSLSLKIKHGKLLFKTQDYVNSEVVLKECLKQNPEDVLAKFALIETYLAQNKIQDAVAQLDTIPTINLNSENNAVIYSHLVNAIKGSQFARKFLNDYLEGKSIDLSDRVHFAIAEIDFSEGNHQGAEQNALQAIRINPENGAALGLLGRINRKLGNLDQAIFYLAKAIEMQDPVLDDLLELGRSYIDRRETKLALDAFKKAIFQYPERPEPYFMAAQVQRDCKDYLSAEKMLRKASTLAPGDLTIHRQLGAIIALNLVHNT